MWRVRSEKGCAAESPSEIRSSTGVSATKKQKTRKGIAESRCAAVGHTPLHASNSAMQNHATNARAIRNSRTVISYRQNVFDHLAENVG